jgi:hypothetical protein
MNRLSSVSNQSGAMHFLLPENMHEQGTDASCAADAGRMPG